MELYSRDRARRSVLDTLGFRALAQISTVLSFTVLVRGLSEQAFGVLNLLYALIPVLQTVGSLGLEHLLRRFQPEYIRNGNPGRAHRLLRLVQKWRLASNLLLIALLLIAWPLTARFFDLGGARNEFLLFAILLLLHFQVTILQISLASQMLHRYSVGSVALLSFIKLVGYGSLAAAGTLTLRSAITVDLIGYALSLLMLWTLQRRNEPHELGASDAAVLPPEEKQRLFRYGKYSHLNDTASILQYSDTDRFFIATMMNAVAVGTYAFYTRLADMMTSFVPQKIFDNIVQPMFFSVPAHEAKEKLPKYFTFLINVTLVYQLPLIVFTAIFHHDIVLTVFGDKYVEYSLLLPIVIAFTTTDNVFSTPIHLVAQYKERTPLIFRSQALGLLQIAGMLILVPLLGIYGAALASGTFHLLRNAFVWSQVKGEAVWLNFRVAAVRLIAIWGAAAMVCWAMRSYVTLPALVEMIFGGAVCALGALAAIRSEAISSDDRQLLHGLMSGKLDRFRPLLRL